jgi:hypothetical protein
MPRTVSTVPQNSELEKEKRKKKTVPRILTAKIYGASNK